jgi:hypothetical protein
MAVSLNRRSRELTHILWSQIITWTTRIVGVGNAGNSHQMWFAFTHSLKQVALKRKSG